MDADLSWAVIKACGFFLFGMFAWAVAGLPLAMLIGRVIKAGDEVSEAEPPISEADLMEELDAEFPPSIALAA